MRPDDVELTLPRVHVVALLDATEGESVGPMVAARQRLRSALGTEELHRYVEARRTSHWEAADPHPEDLVRMIEEDRT